MRRSIIYTLLLLTAAAPCILPQEAFGWKSFSSKQSITSASATATGFWAGSPGGAFFYSPAAGTFLELNKSEGLSASNMTAVTTDGNGRVWMGYDNGRIDVYDPANGQIKNLSDIANSSFTNKRVNSLRWVNDSLLAATAFGLTVINTRTLAVYDTYFKFGSFPSSTPVRASLKHRLMYAATDAGLAVQKAGATNLSSPDSWLTYSTGNGLRSNLVTSVASFHDTLVVGTAQGLHLLSNGAIVPFLTAFNTFAAKQLTAAGDTLFLLMENSLFYYTGGSWALWASFNAEARAFAGIAGGEAYVATAAGLARAARGGTPAYLYPNGPNSNNFVSLAVDTRGSLWAASGQDVTGKGMFRYNGSSWKNFTTAMPGVFSNGFKTVYAAPNGSVYGGTWGTGFYRAVNDSITANYSAANSPLRGIVEDTMFVVITGLAADSRGNIWSLNYKTANRKTLAALTPQGEWHLFANYYDSSLIDYTGMIIDQYDTKWFICSGEVRKGLFYFNENKTFGKTSDDKSGYLGLTAELANKGINALAVDKRGELWIGTSLGVYIISSPGSVLNTSGTPRITSLFSLRQYTANAIAVDAINRKWIGTEQGLLLVSPDGNTLLASYNARNSPLVSDKITSVAVDEATGTVYAGCDGGLAAFRTNAVKPSENFSLLRTYPSPLVLTGNGETLRIEGLIRDSGFKVLSLDGRVLRTALTPGGNVGSWDGRTDDGSLVGSGVYLIAVYDTEGNTVSTAKVAVIRK